MGKVEFLAFRTSAFFFPHLCKVTGLICPEMCTITDDSYKVQILALMQDAPSVAPSHKNLRCLSLLLIITLLEVAELIPMNR